MEEQDTNSMEQQSNNLNSENGCVDVCNKQNDKRSKQNTANMTCSSEEDATNKGQEETGLRQGRDKLMSVLIISETAQYEDIAENIQVNTK